LLTLASQKDKKATKRILIFYLSIYLNYSLRVTRVKKSNRALLILSVLSLLVLAPLETFAAIKIKPDFSVDLIIDKQIASQTKQADQFYDAATEYRPSAVSFSDATTSSAATNRLALVGPALATNKPSIIKKVKINKTAETVDSNNAVTSASLALAGGATEPVALISAAISTSASINTNSSDLAPPASKVPAPAKTDKTRKALPAQLVKPPGPRYGPEKFYDGYCTDYVARYYDHGRGLAWYDNAGAWLYRARQAGWPTGATPRVGAIMVTSEGGGHVALVKSINYDTKTFVVSEQNYVGFGKISSRPVHFGASFIKGFIY